MRNSSPARSLSPYNQKTPIIEKESSPVKEYQTPLKSSPQAKPVRKQPVLRLEEEDELVRAFREQISLEKELDLAKISLA